MYIFKLEIKLVGRLETFLALTKSIVIKFVYVDVSRQL